MKPFLVPVLLNSRVSMPMFSFKIEVFLFSFIIHCHCSGNIFSPPCYDITTLIRWFCRRPEVWTCSPAEHTGRQHPLVLQGTSGAGHAKPECQSGGFPGPFVCCQVRTACSVQRTGASVVAATRLHPEHLLKWNIEKRKHLMEKNDFCKISYTQNLNFSRILTQRNISGGLLSTSTGELCMSK